jgi:hypothetical protein
MRIAISLFLVTAAVYLFSTGAHAYSVDETTNYASARAFVQTGSPDLRSQIDNPFPSTRLLKVEHPDQPRITGRYGLLAWLSMVPAYAAASAFGPVPEPVGPAFPQGGDILPLAGLLFNPLIGATLVALIYLLARSVALSRWHSLAAAIIAGFASPIWVYSSTLSSIPLATTLIIAALLALARGRQRHQIALALSSGLLAGLAAATRPDFILFAPILLIAAFAIRPQPVGAAVARAALWAVGWAIVVVPGVGFYNLYRTGDVLNFGYSEQTFLWATDRAHIGLFGILASSGFGLFVYFPLGILGLWGLLTGGGVRWLRWTMAAATLMAIFLYGTFNDWEGGVSWGPRYLTSIVPLLAIGVGCLLAGPRVSLPARLGEAFLAVWGAAVSVLGILFDYQRGWQNLWDVGARPDQIIWDPHFSPIGAHLRLLRQWLDGLIEPDFYLAQKLGVWTVPALIGVLAVILMGTVAALARARLSAAIRPG